MSFKRINAALCFFISILISLFLCGPVSAYDNPDLLPTELTPVIDLARALSNQQRTRLEESLNEYENETGWKIRVLSQYERTPGLALKSYWGLDERSLLVVADPRGGNLLNFNVGDAYFALMPRLFWVELQTRFGNQYYVKEHGEDGSILDAISAIKICLDKGGCKVVPGLPREQWLWTLSTSILGGIIAGFAAYPREKNQLIAWPWLLLLSPLWLMLFGVFGLAPIITRTSEVLPLFRNSLGFIGSALAAYLVAQSTFSKNNTEDK
tara:strand:- start:1195 stop:1995 length:801 start_codon:yes stop_codon:yes gene_type:complete